MITIHHVTSDTALYHRYRGESAPQDCFVELDCGTGELAVAYDPEIGGGIPVRVYHGHRQRWGIPALKARAANALLDAIAPLAQRVCEGYGYRRDGNNHVADFNDDAEVAREAIEALCDDVRENVEDDTVSAWDACDWYGGIGSYDAQRDALGITAATTDADLDAIETREDVNASGYGCDVIEGRAAYLRRLRDEAVAS